MRGRKSLPTQVKKRRGTLRLCRMNPNEPGYEQMANLPDAPEVLSDYGKEIYYDTARELIGEGILTKISFPIFVMYVIEISRYYDAQEHIKQMKPVAFVEGPTGRKLSINPYHRIAMDALANAVRIACEFGLTPSSQQKVGGGKEKEHFDEFEEISNG